MNISDVLEGLSYNERRLLIFLGDTGEELRAEEIVDRAGFQNEVEVMNSASWLANKGLLNIKETTQKFYSLNREDVLASGLPERRALDALSEKGGSMPLEQLAQSLPAGEDKIAIGWLRRKGLADIVKKDDSKILSLTSKGQEQLNSPMEDEKALALMASGPLPEGGVEASILKDLRGRQDLIVESVHTERRIALTDSGRQAWGSGIELKKEVGQITPELIQTGGWKAADLRRYDVQTYAPSVYPAKKHPLTRLGNDIRNIFTQMGFTEIDEEYVQPAFWNLDVLFTPQDHPARELQDTFYLSRPERLPVDDEELVATVKAIHENGGGTGSKGWGGEWSRDAAELALLRTHTTVNTIRHLSRLPEPPVKVFSLSRIFRKESIDATHLPEFTQIEGIIVDENADFDMLISVVKDFYSRMGFQQIRIRPAYFPYTEPSLEVEVFFNGKWMELGGAGIFRPEVVAPFGIHNPVLAWGFGFERLAMLKWDIRDIRDLYISDLELLRKNPTF